MSVDDIVNDITLHMANDGSANYIRLHENLNIVGTVTSIILGLMVTIIIIGVPLVVALELMYINFPLIQNGLERALIKTTGNLNKALGLMLHDAKLAVLQANTVESGRDANWIYLKIKCKMVLLSVVFVLLTLQGGHYIVQIIVKIAQAILEGFYKAI